MDKKEELFMKKLTTIITCILVVSCLVLTLTGCGSPVKGTWTDESGLLSYTFEGGGKGTMTTVGVEVPLTYEIEDDTIIINGVRYTFEVDGDKLTLTSELLGTSTTYTKE